MAKKKVRLRGQAEPAAATGKVNKSDAVRTYARENPEAKPQAIAEALTKQLGIEVKAQAVSNILSQAKKKGGDAGEKFSKAMDKPAKQAKPAKRKEAEGTDAALYAAGRLVVACGGDPDKIKAAIATATDVIIGASGAEDPIYLNLRERR